MVILKEWPPNSQKNAKHHKLLKKNASQKYNYFIQVRMGIRKDKKNHKSWQGCGEMEIHILWDYKLAQHHGKQCRVP